MKTSRFRAPIILLAFIILFVLMLFSGWIARFITDAMWFHHEGFGNVFWGILLKRFSIGGVVGLFSAIFLYVNGLWAVRHSEEKPLILPAELAASRIGDLLGRASMKRVLLGISLFWGVVLGLGTSAWWQDVLLYLHASQFGFEDPIFNRDAGFYIFTLPVLTHVRNLLWGLVILSALICGTAYFLRGAFTIPIMMVEGRMIPRGVKIPQPIRRHLGLHAALILALIAVSSYLRRYTLMFDSGPLISGPGYADVYGTLPLLMLRTVTALFAAVAVFFGLVRSRPRWILGSILLMVIAYIVTEIYPSLIQRFSVLPNEFVREKPFIANHIKATRFAYGLGKIKDRSLAAEATLTQADINANRATINNIRLWDHEPLLETFGQVQEIRTYYDFVSVDNDRYTIDGELRQTMLSPRELVPASLPQRTWINERMTYTHGYGVAMGPVNQVSQEGLPELFVKDLPPKVAHKELAIQRPEIYFGERTQDPIFVKTRTPEFDYPSGEENVSSFYQGDGGVGIGNFFSRALFALRFADMKMILSTNFTDESRVVFYRNVIERVKNVAKFLTYDDDPYMVIHEGQLVWIVDAYTSARRFPYSERIGRLGNYIRNSVKITVNAYDGRMNFYIADPDDPIVRAWAGAFPGMLKPIEQMPPGLRAHLRHPEDYFRIQAEMFATYHMEDPQIFYSKEDVWEVPRIQKKDKAEEMHPYYTVMKLPGETGEEFILMLPFTPKSKDNLAAWMVARNDGDHYGDLVVYRLPKEKLVYGPQQIEARINQDERISPQITLWSQQGSQADLGTLLVIPIENSILYVQPLYLKASNGRIPELKRVIAGYESQIVMAPTLDEALRGIFGGAPPTPEIGKPAQAPAPPGGAQPPGVTGIAELAAEAQARYDAASRAAREGDWARYGQEIRKLGDTLSALQKSTQSPQSQAPSNP